MRQGQFEQRLFLRGWISPTGLLGQNSVFERPVPSEDLNVFKRAYFPLSSILRGGEVKHRILVTYELDRETPQGDIQSIEIQERSRESAGWFTETIHTPVQFDFKLVSDLSFKNYTFIKEFLRFASGQEFTLCVPEETTLGQITLRSSDQKYRGASLCVSLDEHGGTIVDVKSGPNVIIGAPSLKLVDFDLTPAEAGATITDRLMRASAYSAEHSGFTKRLISWFSPR